MKLAARLGLVAAVLALAAPVHAQSAHWSDQPPPKTPGDMVPTLDRYRYFIDCVATSQWAWAGALFDTEIGSREEQKLLSRITGGDDGTRCSYALQMRMTSTLMRGGIAEARYRFMTRSEPAPAAGSEELVPAPTGASFKWVGFGKESPEYRQYVFANCLVERDMGAVHAVLNTRMGSKEERAEMQRLSRRFGACLQPGEQLNANMVTLRPWLGEAQFQFYRKSKGNA